MPALKLTREDALDLISDVFRRYGYEGTTYRLISEATGWGRASLYHHFPGGKEEIAREVFRHVGAQVEDLVLAPLGGDGAPEDRVRAMIQGVRSFYDRGAKSCLLGAMALSGGSELFSQELARSFDTWIGTLSRVLRQAGVPRGEARRRAEAAVGQIQGALVVSRGLGNKRPFERALKALADQLFAA